MNKEIYELPTLELELMNDIDVLQTSGTILPPDEF